MRMSEAGEGFVFIANYRHEVFLARYARCRYYTYMETAKLFTTGGSQAVRLPKEYRFQGSEVFIRKEGEAVIIEPKSKGRWPRGFFKRIRIMDRNFRRPRQGSLPAVAQL